MLIGGKRPALHWPSFSLACSMSSSGSDGNIAVIHLCFPLLQRHKTNQSEHRLLKLPVLTETKLFLTVSGQSVVTHSVCDLSRIWCLSCWPSHSCRWKMKPEMPCSFWLRSFTFSSPILAWTNTMNFHVLQKRRRRKEKKTFIFTITTVILLSRPVMTCWWIFKATVKFLFGHLWSLSLCLQKK